MRRSLPVALVTVLLALAAPAFALPIPTDPRDLLL